MCDDVCVCVQAVYSAPAQNEDLRQVLRSLSTDEVEELVEVLLQSRLHQHERKEQEETPQLDQQHAQLRAQAEVQDLGQDPRFTA